jgi:deazaflavin-dependent oxidoreductase (nitroreductase family)
MIEHIGRNSGERRYVVVEIVDRPTPGTVIVASGFGTRAQWYRNILANPSVRVWIASHPPRIANASPLPAGQAAAVLDRYAQHHPRAWAALQPVFETTLNAKIGRDGTTLPLACLDLGVA